MEEWFKAEAVSGEVRMFKFVSAKNAEEYAEMLMGEGVKLYTVWDERWDQLPSPYPAWAYYA